MTSFFIETYGCSQNAAESETMAGLLAEAKFELVPAVEDADIIIFNTATVNSPTADAFFHRVETIRKEYPYKTIVIAGCIPQAEWKRLKEFPLAGTQQYHKIVEVVEEALNNNIIHILETGEMPPLNLPKIRKNPVVEIIPISRGCLSACIFCEPRQAGESLQSYPLQDIVEIAGKAVRQGAQEIWLASQDTMCYGFTQGTSLTALLKELVEIPGNFKIRVGIGNPLHLKKIKNELFPLLLHPKIFRFLHLPLQAGSNKVLQDMRWGNTAEDYLELVREARKSIPELTLATDIIVGFPTETEDDFWQTLEMVKKTTPDIITISRFWPRPGTTAAEMKEIPVEEVTRRTSVLTNIFHNISRLQNERWLGWEGSIVIDEKGTGQNQWTGRNYAYKPVMVEGNYRLGEKIHVTVQKVGVFELRGIPQSKVVPYA